MPASPYENAMGVLVSPKAAARAISPEHMRRLCYTTTKSADFSDTHQTSEDRSESMEELHMTGYRATKYLGYKLNQAPGFDRSSGNYFWDYTKKPQNAAIDRQLALENRPLPPLRAPTKLDGSTRYGENFGPVSSSDLQRAKQPNQAPPIDETTALGPVGTRLLSLTTSTQDFFKAPAPLSRSLSAADFRHKPMLGISRTASTDTFGGTQYNRDFGPKASLLARWCGRDPNFKAR